MNSDGTAVRQSSGFTQGRATFGRLNGDEDPAEVAAAASAYLCSKYRRQFEADFLTGLEWTLTGRLPA